MYIHLHDMSIFHFSEGMVGKMKWTMHPVVQFVVIFPKLVCLPSPVTWCNFYYYISKSTVNRPSPFVFHPMFFSVGNLSCELEEHIWILERPGKGFLLPSFVLVECYRFDFLFFSLIFSSIVSFNSFSSRPFFFVT